MFVKVVCLIVEAESPLLEICFYIGPGQFSHLLMYLSESITGDRSSMKDLREIFDLDF